MKKSSKQKMWGKDEVYHLKIFFNNTPLMNRKLGVNKTELIQLSLVNRGFELRTLSSIRKKLFRLGLTDYEVKNEPLVKIKCSKCLKEIEVKLRYIKMYKNLKCPECVEKQRQQWSKSSSGKEYHKQYIKDWRKNKN